MTAIPHEVLRLSEAASRLKDNADFNLITSEIRKELFASFSKTNVPDVEAREEIHRLSYTLDLIEKRMEKYISVVKLHATDET